MKKILVAAIFSLACLASQAQTQYYKLYAKNITRVDTNHVTFNIYVVKIAGDSLKLGLYDFTFGFDFAHIANGGSVTASFVANSSDTALLPASQETPTIHSDSMNNYFRVVCARVQPASDAAKMATGSGTKLGTIKLTGTNPFVVGSSLNLTWIRGRLLFYINTRQSLFDAWIPWRAYVLKDVNLN